MVEQYLTCIEAAIKKEKFGREPHSLYQPIRYIMALGGKRLRPLLTMLSYSLYKSDVEKIIPCAVAVEAFHNFTLLHDDIMDQAPLRRGKPTVHKKWNVNTAILSGDVMLIKVYDLFLCVDEKKLKSVLELFSRCAIEVCEGQQWDMEFETKNRISESHYLKMIKLKTAVLLGFCLELGALLGEASDGDRKALRNFGINIGVGFQLKDDWLDVYANQKKFGKQVGGDIVANKKTFLLIKALESAKGKSKKELQQWMTQKDFVKSEKIKAVTKIYNDLNIGHLTEQKAKHFFKKAFQQLDEISPAHNVEPLKTLVMSLIDREV